MPRRRASNSVIATVQLSSDEEDENQPAPLRRSNRPRKPNERLRTMPPENSQLKRINSASDEAESTPNRKKKHSIVILGDEEIDRSVDAGPSHCTRSRLPLQPRTSRPTLGERCTAEIAALKAKYGEEENGFGVKVVDRGSAGNTVTVSVNPVLDARTRSFSVVLLPYQAAPQTVKELKHFPPVRAQLEFSTHTSKISVHCSWMNRHNLIRLKSEMTKVFKAHNGEEPFQAALSWLEKSGIGSSGILVRRCVTYCDPQVAKTEPHYLQFEDLEIIRQLFWNVKVKSEAIAKCPATNGIAAFDCAICFDHKSVMNAVMFGCHHVFCQGCMKQDFELKIKESRVKELQCLAENCAVPARTETVKSVVDHEVFQRYCDLTTDNAVDGPTFVRCPKATCNTPMELDPNGPREIVCLSCRHQFCCLCKANPHPHSPCLSFDQKREIRERYKNGTAKDKRELERQYGMDNIKFALEDAESEDWIAKNAKPCPKCKTPIQKTVGCNKITCTAKGCHTYFCWLCGEALAHGDPYTHYQNGTCAGRLHEGNNIMDFNPFLINQMMDDSDSDQDMDISDEDDADSDIEPLPLFQFSSSDDSDEDEPVHGGGALDLDMNVHNLFGAFFGAFNEIPMPLLEWAGNLDSDDSDDEEDDSGDSSSSDSDDE